MSPPGVESRRAAVIGPTPQFLYWALRWRCPLRAGADGRDLERTVRRLRPLSAAAQAVAEGRVIDGVALRPDPSGPAERHLPPLGFCLDRLLDWYGGRESVDRYCGGCPANADALPDLTRGSAQGPVTVSPLQAAPGVRSQPPRWAGCWGILTRYQVPGDAEIVAAIEQSQHRDEFAALFPRTHPPWYGWWIAGTISPRGARALKSLFDSWATPPSNASAAAPVNRFCRALAMATRRQELCVQLVPAGWSDGQTWTVGPYCPRCRAGMTQRERRCRVCRRVGGPHPVRRRCVLGLRPYVPLAHFMSPIEADRLAREFDNRQHQTSRSPPC